DFILYTLGGESSISAVLTQTNDKKEEQPIAFFSEGLKEYEDKYSFVEKQTLAVIRALKKFRHLLSQSKIHLLVPHASMEDFFLSKDISEKRAGWITKVVEYDVDT
ncbi:RNase H-like domain-containing protein, partial [Enterobacter hormaechei]|uniref:RNase H-like domain-containing protein n=1 Tax=Enterobacter hormaechei TaxID=158836 RepID=UPI0023E3EA76